jgi:hypoxanthine phosphoribosyltransferase
VSDSGRVDPTQPSGGLPGRVVVGPDEIASRVGELAAEIDAVYAGACEAVVLICVLKGSLFFTADLARALRTPVEIDAIAVRSYGAGRESSGTVQLLKDVGMPLEGRHVLLVEDVIDTGLTTAFLHDHLARHRPASLRLVSLLDKPGRRVREVRLDFRGFVIPDAFVVGYGLDLDERYRNLPGVHVLDDAGGGPPSASPPSADGGQETSPPPGVSAPGR